jgi:hypothetical protein
MRADSQGREAHAIEPLRLQRGEEGLPLRIVRRAAGPPVAAAMPSLAKSMAIATLGRCGRDRCDGSALARGVRAGSYVERARHHLGARGHALPGRRPAGFRHRARSPDCQKEEVRICAA